MQSFRVLSAVYDAVHDRMEVVKEITEDDGSTNLNLHTFHPDTLEWRAAEYDISDPDELLDLIMHEPFIEDVKPIQRSVDEAQQLVRQRLAEAKGRLASPKDKNKAEHKNRLRSAGVDEKYVTAADEDPVVVMKRHCPFDQEVIDVKREHIVETRNQHAVERERERTRAKPTPTERAERLRKALTARQAGKRESQPVMPKGQVRSKPIVLSGKKAQPSNE